MWLLGEGHSRQSEEHMWSLGVESYLGVFGGHKEASGAGAKGARWEY